MKDTTEQPTKHPVRIGVDGYNLALEQGTGIATYSRNLTYALRKAGAGIDVLYGRNIPSPGLFSTARRADADLLKEIGFFDPAPALDIDGFLAGAFWGFNSLRSPSVQEIPLRGHVLARDFQERLPAFDRILNSRNLFALAFNHFEVWRRMLRIRIPNPPEVMHWTYPIPVEIVGTKNIYTIHDLIPLRLPHTTADLKRSFLRLVQTIGRRADHIVTVSETSKADILEIMGVPEYKVTNTFQAVDLGAQAPEQALGEDITRSLGLPEKGYFLFFGAIEPKKNVGRLLEGFLAANVQAPLLIVGKKAWKSELELRLLPLALRARGAAEATESKTTSGSVSTLGNRDPRIVHIDYVPQSMLINLIRNARAVVFPSLYEGFGLPVLEAMLLGTPVITSNSSSLPEVAGDAALFVDPYSPRAIAEAIRQVDGDGQLRSRLAAMGPARANLFSPAKYQERLRDLYGKLNIAL